MNTVGLRMGNKNGFTLVELLIVVVVIAILAAITIVSYNGITQRANNSERQTDINAIQKAVELFYVDNSYYPQQGTVVGMGTDFPVTTLKLPRTAIIAPGSTAGTTNSIAEDPYDNTVSVSTYVYRAYMANGDSCWASNHVCVGYKMWFRLQGETVAKTVQGGLVP